MSNNTTGGRSLTNQGYILAKDTLDPNQVYTMFGGLVNGQTSMVLQRKQTDGSEVIYSYYIPEPGSVFATVWADRASLAYNVTVPVGGLELPAEPGTSSGGGGTVTVNNFPDNFPDNEARDELIEANSYLIGIAANTEGADDKLLALLSEVGAAGTAETGNIPDGVAAGSGIRKMAYALWDVLSQLFQWIQDFTTVGTGISSGAQQAHLVRNLEDSYMVQQSLDHITGNAFANVDGRAFKSVSFRCISLSGVAPTIEIQESMDGVTWFTADGYIRDGVRQSRGTTDTIALGRHYILNINARYVRFAIVAAGTGSSSWFAKYMQGNELVHQAQVFDVRTRDYDPVTIATGVIAINTVLGGVLDVTDCEGVTYFFAASGNSGAGALTPQYSLDGVTWINAYGYAYSTNQESSTYATSLSSGGVINSTPRLFVPTQGRYIRLICLTNTITLAAGAYAQKVHEVPMQAESRTRAINVVTSTTITTDQVVFSGGGTNWSTASTFTLTAGINRSYSAIVFQMNLNTCTALTATVQASIDGTNWVQVDTLNYADFVTPEIVKRYVDMPYQNWRVVITAITGTLIYRGFRASL